MTSLSSDGTSLGRIHAVVQLGIRECERALESAVRQRSVGVDKASGAEVLYGQSPARDDCAFAAS